jgi:ferritin-like metal-binding protein YciE
MWELRDLDNAENQLVKALPKMAKAASSTELEADFTAHLKQTKGHVDRPKTYSRLWAKVQGVRNVRAWRAGRRGIGSNVRGS